MTYMNRIWNRIYRTNKHPSRRTRARLPSLSTCRLGCDSLERRSMMDIAAALAGHQLTITLTGANDVATLSNNGREYVVSGQAYAVTHYEPTTPKSFLLSDVDSIRVVGTNANDSQRFSFLGALPSDSLIVDKSVEMTKIGRAHV